MRVATRLTLMMLTCLAPIAIGYTLVTVRSTTQIFSEDLKAEARAAQRALNASLTPDVRQKEWDEVHDILKAIGREDLIAALLDVSGRVSFALPAFPITPPPVKWITERINASGLAEFMSTEGGRTWSCSIVPLGEGVPGFLLVAQDWTALRRDRYRRIAASLLAIAAVILVVVSVIPFVADRYISQPLAELRRRAVALGSDGGDSNVPGDEMKLISTEFRRVDDELASARRRLQEATERRVQLERRLLHADKLATIGTLASGFAHEIGTPLGVIRSRAELLLNHHSDENKLRDGLNIVIDQIDRITRIVHLLLNLARRHEPIRRVVDLRSVIEGTVRLIETEASQRRVTVTADLGTAPLWAECDADQLQQVFVNLAINALDAMEKSGGSLRFVATTDSDQIRLAVEDAGPGVPETIRERIFDPFFTTKDPGRGTGMGLAVSQSIVADHDGSLQLEGSAKGARFVVTLPIAPSTQLRQSASAK